MEDTRTELELIQEAIDVQNACNLSGIVHGFSRSITRLRQLHPSQGTEFYNKHQISKLFADKIMSLTGEVSLDDFRINGEN